MDESNPKAPASLSTVRLTRWLKSSPDRVFSAWTQADKISQWLSPSSEISVIDAVFEARVGGAFQIGYANPAEKQDAAWVRGQVLEVDPPHRLVLLWVWEKNDEFPAPFIGQSTRVSVELSALDGGTQLVLTHEQLPEGFVVQRHTWGWTSTLDRLERLVVYSDAQ